jgi:putative sterol carrier protein
MTPQEIFDQMSANVNADAAKGLNSTIQFNLSGDNGGQWHVAIKDGKADVATGTAASPNMTLSMTSQDYVDMVMGKLNGQMAFMSGKLKISGDMGLAMKMQNLFKRPGA